MYRSRLGKSAIVTILKTSHRLRFSSVARRSRDKTGDMPHTEDAPALVSSDDATQEAHRRRSARGIHGLEVALVILALVNLCVLPWAFGGVDASCELASACVSICALCVALLPRHSDDEATGL